MKPLLKGFYHTPPLWKNRQLGLQQFELPVVDIVGLESIAIPQNLRLGHQMEHVFRHLIMASTSHEVVFGNILIEEGKTRIGELDFILREKKTQSYLHVELAYKFYLINSEISEPIYRLMGPNKRDMFYTKMDKLKKKQLPLLYHEQLNTIWAAHNINPQEIQQTCCFKAQLFSSFEKVSSIRPLNTECIVGKWIRFDDFNSKAFSNAFFYLTRKLEWVLTPHKNVPWMNHFETLMEVNLRMVKENAPMLWMRSPSGTLEKMFVVWW